MDEVPPRHGGGKWGQSESSFHRLSVIHHDPTNQRRAPLDHRRYLPVGFEPLHRPFKLFRESFGVNLLAQLPKLDLAHGADCLPYQVQGLGAFIVTDNGRVVLALLNLEDKNGNVSDDARTAARTAYRKLRYVR